MLMPPLAANEVISASTPRRSGTGIRNSELRIPVPDRRGVLAEITSLAANGGISIYDIEIAHSAEGPRGVLILVVDSAEAERLRDAIEAQGYHCSAERL